MVDEASRKIGVDFGASIRSSVVDGAHHVFVFLRGYLFSDSGHLVDIGI